MSRTEVNGSLVARLRREFAPEQVLTAAADLQEYGQDWLRFYPPAPAAIFLPRTVDDVVAIVRLANRDGFALVPSGGRTGLSGGATAPAGEVLVSMARMARILSFSESDRTVTCEAGVVTARLQERAREEGLFYPVDFASSGSSQIGGNVATNAGGIRVIRYGLTRDWVRGLRVVTGAGELLDLNQGLIKNATGYDLRHLFIGSEGTLGIVVEATMGLTDPPRAPQVMLLAVPAMAELPGILNGFRQRVLLNAFEFFSDEALQQVLARSGLEPPVAERAPFYALLEYDTAAADAAEEALAVFATLLESGAVTDGVVSQSAVQAKALWRYREDISEAISPRTPYKNDVSVLPSRVPAFLADAERAVAEHYPEFELIWFGHIGDGNLHLNILRPPELAVGEFKARCDAITPHIYAIVAQHGGSISAEHGVGLLKRDYLGYTRSESELRYLLAIKRQLDPNGIMNPGKLFAGTA